jgi:hypothetical protein
VKDLFFRTTELCKKENLKRVAVLTCGPPSLVNEVDDLCRRSKMSLNCDNVVFDCHKEIFDF